MSKVAHQPVLKDEVLGWLRPKPGQIFLDLTLGRGGHAWALAHALGPKGRLIALDRDPDAIAAVKEAWKSNPPGASYTLIQGNFRDFAKYLTRLGISPWNPKRPRSGVHGMLIDLGVSSPQLDRAERGFSFQKSGPLDMRMSQEGMTAAQWIQSVSVKELAQVLKRFGDVPKAFVLARKIKGASEQGKLLETTDLKRIVESVLRPHRKKIHPATQVFQAIRMAVNDEQGALKELLQYFVDWLKPKGRAAWISFHSGEDRLIKQTLRFLENPCACPPDLPFCVCSAKPVGKVLTRRPIRASEEEILRNPRARSAKLRVFQKF